jgi:tRNA threonylcarbamoyladenosine biosynthesis protein TsaE
MKTVFLNDDLATHNFGVSLADLGSGKTTLVKGLGVGLGINDPIVSPTFTLINEYYEGNFPLYHFDLYRLNHHEVSSLNLEIYWEGIDFPLGIVVIEWAERMLHKPAHYMSIHLQFWLEGRKADIINN